MRAKPLIGGVQEVMRRLAWCTALIFVVCPHVCAQPGTDFNGHWILESPSTAPPDAARALIVRQSVRKTNVRGLPVKPFFDEISIEFQSGGNVRLETHTIGIIGGSVSGSNADPREAQPRRQQHAVRWDAATLVFESGSYAGYDPASAPWTERRETWSMDSTGRLQVAITTRSSAEAARTVVLTYRRR